MTRADRPCQEWGPRVRCRGACQSKTIDDGAVIELRRGFEPVCKLLMPVGQIGQDVPDAVEGSEFVVLRLVASYQHIGGCSKVGHHGAQVRRVLAKERGKLDILRIEISLIDHRAAPASTGPPDPRTWWRTTLMAWAARTTAAAIPSVSRTVWRMSTSDVPSARPATGGSASGGGPAWLAALS
ncbi:hypothetical protein WR25_26006 [Diploscapter pachys]|uniref:Uncharacterized protein n=1 Tax=Diploscapter pachys TaxID=2018661 RepID=A0A2A2K4S9_9BILA|nr:hypothetical protein WR25_26006 [Diploscapter pachys]